MNAVHQRLVRQGEDERDAKVLSARDAREKLTAKPWWDMPCHRGECPGPFDLACCNERHEPHSDAGMEGVE